MYLSIPGFLKYICSATTEEEDQEERRRRTMFYNRYRVISSPVPTMKMAGETQL